MFDTNPTIENSIMRLIPLPTKFILAIETIQWILPNPSILQYEPFDRLMILQQPQQNEQQLPMMMTMTTMMPTPPSSVLQLTSSSMMIQDVLPKDSSLNRIFENIPMTLQELQSLLHQRNEQQQQSLHPDGTVSTSASRRCEQYAILALALLCLGNQYPSQAHNLVTPLSWSEDTYFGFASPSKYFHKASWDVLAMASYIHSLVHRYEGLQYGEYGMMGYTNANFWTQTSLAYNNKIKQQRIKIMEEEKKEKNNNMNQHPFTFNEKYYDLLLPLSTIQKEITHYAATGNKIAEQWCLRQYTSNTPLITDEDHDTWDPRALHQLCVEIIQYYERGYVVDMDQQQQHHPLHSFAQDAATIELKILLFYCLQQAGFDIISNLKNQQEKQQSPSSSSSSVQLVTVDHHLAVQSANKISTAHIDAFISNHFVLLRRIMMMTHGTEQQHPERERISIAMGIACRLLNTPACFIVQKEEYVSSTQSYDTVMESVFIYISTQQDDEIEMESLIPFFNPSKIYYGGGSLTKGDALVIHGNRLFDDKQKQQHDNPWDVLSHGWIQVMACSLDHPKVGFIDPLHGLRGTSPTSVIQWSKGTIHKTF